MYQTSLEPVGIGASAERSSILDAWRAGGPDAILATVVEAHGSMDCGVGSHVLLPSSFGKAWSGTIAEFDMTSSEHAVEAFGLDIDGRVRVWMESLEAPGAAAAIEFLDECRQAGREAVVATVIDVGDCARIRPGERLFVTAAGAAGSLLGTPLERELLRHTRTALSERRGGRVFLGDCEVLLEWAGPPKPLVIFGSGSEAEALAHAARAQGFEPTLTETPAEIEQTAPIVLVMSDVLPEDHAEADAQMVSDLAANRPSFLGVVGPEARTARLMREVAYDPVIHIVRAPADNLLAIVGEIDTVLRGLDTKVLGRQPPAKPPDSSLTEFR